MIKKKRALVLSGGGARGAYQAGVWKYLLERGWSPDLICGTSVGAINAVAIGSGMNPEELSQIWSRVESGRIYRIPWWRHLLQILRRAPSGSLLDSAPLREYLERHLDLKALHKSPTEVLISAVNIRASRLQFFRNEEIRIDHVMASSAIPILFPWQMIDGEPMWDGGVMANTPIAPALERGVDEIVVVLLSPVGGRTLPVPTNRQEAMEHAFEQLMIGSYESFMSRQRWVVRENHGAGVFRGPDRNVRIVTVSPTRMLGFQSIMNFSAGHSGALMEEGYRDAAAALGDFFASGGAARSPGRKSGKKVTRAKQKR